MADSKKRLFTKSYRSPVAFTRLKQLRCFEAVHEKIINGYPIVEIAKFIQQNQGEYLDVGQQSLMDTLTRYRTIVPPLEMIRREEMPISVARKLDQAEANLDEIAEMRKLYDIQVSRIEMDNKLEKQINKALNTLGNEIRIAKELLESSAKLKQETGVMRKELGTISIDGHMTHSAAPQKPNTAVQNILDNPQSRNKILNIAQSILKSAGNKLASDMVLPAEDITQDTDADSAIEAELADIDESDEE